MLYLNKKDLVRLGIDIEELPNIHVSGSIKGMRKFYGWKGKVFRHGNYIYHVSKRNEYYGKIFCNN